MQASSKNAVHTVNTIHAEHVVSWCFMTVFVWCDVCSGSHNNTTNA